MIAENAPVVVKEVGVLEKFEGEPTPENLIGKVYVEDGHIVRVENYLDGELVSAEGIEVLDT